MRALLLAFALTAPTRAQAPAAPDSMESRVDAVFACYDTPGCAVAVLQGDEVVLQKAYGVAHLGFGVPMSTATSLWIPYSEEGDALQPTARALTRRSSIDLGVTQLSPLPPLGAVAPDRRPG